MQKDEQVLCRQFGRLSSADRSVCCRALGHGLRCSGDRVRLIEIFNGLRDIDKKKKMLNMKFSYLGLTRVKGLLEALTEGVACRNARAPRPVNELSSTPPTMPKCGAT